tara:strand:+ start:2365 stop:3423 length:1059 start_codon:yes stop_codon:yes gene_type:complete
MIANTANYQNIMYASGSFLRPASIFSFLTHILIICIAVYGLPNFGRKLPPDLTVISFELLKVVEETNLDFTDQKNLEKKDIKKIEKKDIKKIEKKADKNVKETKKQITPQNLVKQVNSPSEKPSIPVSPSEKPSIPVLPSKKPKKNIEKETPIQKPKINKKIANIQKPIMKPQIQKEKIKKNKTNPNALTSVLKTLEKVKETQKQKQMAEIEKNKKEVADKKKKKDELATIKNLVTDAISSKPKNLIKPIGISEIDVLKQHISNYWTPPIGAASAENLIVDILMEFNKEGYVIKAKWVNKGMNANNSFYKAAANSAIRAVMDAQPMPLPASKFNEWKKLTFRFDPAKMFGGY